MQHTIQIIPFSHLAFAFIPVLFVIAILWKWGLSYKNLIYAVSRMLIQLLLIGYFLAYIFKTDESLVVVTVLTIMLFSSSVIALRAIDLPLKTLLLKSIIAIVLGGGSILVLITQAVLELDPWYFPSYIIPLAGMIFANAMNSISLAGERLKAEIDRGVTFDQAKNIAFKTSLIPIINSLFAVGLVSLPGMMTGQILSGISPLIAVRYQIMVMCMIFGSAGIAAAIFLTLIRSHFVQTPVPE